MDPALIVTIALGAPSLLYGGYFGFKQVRSTTAADKERAAEGVQKQIDKAVKNADDACQVRLEAKDERILDLRQDVEAERFRANAAEARANALQTSINERGLGPIK